MATARRKITPAQDSDTGDSDDSNQKKTLDAMLKTMEEQGITLEELMAELFPMEGDQIDIRPRRRPTVNVVRRTPICVVMVEWNDSKSTDLDEPLDRDSEGFTTYDDAKAYFDINSDWAKGDAKEFGGHHVLVIFKDTTDFSDTEHVIHSKSAVFKKEATDRLEAGDIDFLFSGKKKPSALMGVKTPKSKPVARTKPRHKKAATTPEVAPKAPIKSDGAKRLAAKRAASKVTPTDEAPKNPAASRKRSRQVPQKAAAETSG